MMSALVWLLTNICSISPIGQTPRSARSDRNATHTQSSEQSREEEQEEEQEEILEDISTADDLFKDESSVVGILL